MRGVAADDPVQPLDRRGKELANRALEVRVAIVLFEIREEELEPEAHVLYIVDEDAIESRAESLRAPGRFFAHTLMICGRY
jgi:hypothetical protein